jgi:hypothetical protein
MFTHQLMNLPHDLWNPAVILIVIQLVLMLVNGYVL